MGYFQDEWEKRQLAKETVTQPTDSFSWNNSPLADFSEKLYIASNSGQISKPKIDRDAGLSEAQLTGIPNPSIASRLWEWTKSFYSEENLGKMWDALAESWVWASMTAQNLFTKDNIDAITPTEKNMKKWALSIKRNTDWDFDQKEREQKAKDKLKLVEEFKTKWPDFLNKISPAETDLLNQWLQEEKGKNEIIANAKRLWLPTPNSKDLVPEESEPVLQEISRALVKGMIQITSAYTKVKYWQTGDEVAYWLKQQKALDNLMKKQEEATPNALDPSKLTWADMLDSRFYTQIVPQQVPFSLMLLAPAWAVWYATSVWVGALVWEWLLSYIAWASTAGITARWLESYIEWADTYSTVIKNWWTKEEATIAGNRTVGDNMMLTWLDISQMAITFAPIKWFWRLGKILATGWKFAYDASSEWFEEVWQGYSQQKNIALAKGGIPLSFLEYIDTQEAKISFIVWAWAWMVLWSVWTVKDVWENIGNKAQSQMEKIDEAVKSRDPFFISKIQQLVLQKAISEEYGKNIIKEFEDRLMEEVGVNSSYLMNQHVNKVLNTYIDDNWTITDSEWAEIALANGDAVIKTPKTKTWDKWATSELVEVNSKEDITLESQYIIIKKEPTESAQEVGEPIVVYHWTDLEGYNNILKKWFNMDEKLKNKHDYSWHVWVDIWIRGTSFTSNKEKTKEFWEHYITSEIDPSANLMDWDKFNELSKKYWKEKTIEKFNIDWLTVDLDWPWSEILMFNLDKIKIKDKKEEIKQSKWIKPQVIKKPIIEPKVDDANLSVEAKKYDNASDFSDANKKSGKTLIELASIWDKANAKKLRARMKKETPEYLVKKEMDKIDKENSKERDNYNLKWIKEYEKNERKLDKAKRVWDDYNILSRDEKKMYHEMWWKKPPNPYLTESAQEAGGYSWPVGQVTAKILKWLVGKTTVEYNFLKSFQTNKYEKAIINKVLKGYEPTNTKIDVQEFADKVENELLPLAIAVFDRKDTDLNINSVWLSSVYLKKVLWLTKISEFVLAHKAPLNTDTETHIPKIKNYFGHTFIIVAKNEKWEIVHILWEGQNDIMQMRWWTAYQKFISEQNWWKVEIETDVKWAITKAERLLLKWWKIELASNLRDKNGKLVRWLTIYGTKTIKINKELAITTTVFHEILHSHVAGLSGKVKWEIEQEWIKKWNITQDSVDKYNKENNANLTKEELVWEYIAEELHYYVENRKFKTKTLGWKIKQLILDIYNQILGKVWLDNKIKTLYDDILSWRKREWFESEMWIKYQKMLATWDCYPVAWKYIMDRLWQWLTLVHWTVTGQWNLEWVRSWHAWVEDENGNVIDASNGKWENPFIVNKYIYYLLGKINEEETVRYTEQEAIKMAVDTGTYWPYHEWPKDAYQVVWDEFDYNSKQKSWKEEADNYWFPLEVYREAKVPEIALDYAKEIESLLEEYVYAWAGAISYPSWIPERLRKYDVLKATLEKIKNWTIITSSRQLEMADIIYVHLNPEFRGLYGWVIDSTTATPEELLGEIEKKWAESKKLVEESKANLKQIFLSDEEALAKMGEMIEQLEDKKWWTPKELKARERLRIQEIAENLRVLMSEKVTSKEMWQFIRKNSYELIDVGFRHAIKTGLITSKEFGEIIANLRKTTEPAKTNVKGRWLTSLQEWELVAMQWWDIVMKIVHKIKTKALSKTIEALKIQQYNIELPSVQRLKIPFTLMGNKATTLVKLIKPKILRAIKSGKTIYYEPFAWAGTTIYNIKEYIEAWVKEIHLNFFDKEKYILVNAVKNGEEVNVEKAWDTIMGDVYNTLMNVSDKEWLDELKELLELVPDVWTKEFKNVAEIMFYPKYAKLYFKNREDGKLAIKWETTETFKEWLFTHLRDNIKLEDNSLTEWELDKMAEEMTEKVLWDTSIFENSYPKLSKAISDALNQYDDIDKVDDVNSALLNTFAKHFRQRWTSGQKVLFASGWFQNLLWSLEKTKEWLANYRKILKAHWDSVTLYNLDWKEFIKRMWKRKDIDKMVGYIDPPYWHTTATYTKNAPADVKASLWEYADYYKLAEILMPISDTSMVLTNDIDWIYYRAINNLLWSNMSKKIMWYKEWTTPTSLISTKDMEDTPNSLNVNPYQLLRSPRFKTKLEILSNKLLPELQESLKKELSKLLKELYKTFSKEFKMLYRIVEWHQNALLTLEEFKADLESWEKEMISKQEKQALIQEANNLAIKWNLSWGALIQLIKLINRLWKYKEKAIQKMKTDIDNFLNSDSISADVKQEFKKEVMSRYTTEKLSKRMEKLIDIAYRINKENNAEYTKEEYDFFTGNNMDDIVSDEERGKAWNLEWKKSIYSLDLDSLEELNNILNSYRQTGKDTLKLRKRNDEWEANLIALRIISDIKNFSISKIKKAWQNLKWFANFLFNLKEWFKNPYDKIKDLNEENTPAVWLFDDKYNIRFVFDMISKEIFKYEHTKERLFRELDAKEKMLGITEQSYEKIWLHALARRWDGQSTIKLIEYLKYFGDITTSAEFEDTEEWYKEILAVVEKYNDEEFLTDEETEMYNFMIETFKELWEDVKKVLLADDNRTIENISNYFPINMDWDTNINAQNVADNLDPEVVKIIQWMKWLFHNSKLEDWFTKQTTGKKLIPLINSRTIFLTHVDNVAYYTNVQPIIKRVARAVEIAKDKMWKWYNYVRRYLDVLITKGNIWARPSDAGKLVASMTRNIAVATLAFNPTTYAIQLTALLEWASTTGKIVVVSLARVMQPKIWKMITEKSEILKFREFEDFYWYTDDNLVGILRKAQHYYRRYGYFPMKLIDQAIWRWVWLSCYESFLDLGMSEEEAIREADVIVVKTMASAKFYDASLFILENNKWFGAMFTIFQTFVINHKSILEYMGWKHMLWLISKNLEKIWVGKAPMPDNLRFRLSRHTTEEQIIQQWEDRKAFEQSREHKTNQIVTKLLGTIMVLMIAWLLFQIAEYWIRKWIGALMWVKQATTNLAQDILNSVLSILPLISQVWGSSRYGWPISLKALWDAGTALYNIAWSTTNEKIDVPKNLINLFFASINIWWVWWTNTIKKIVNLMFPATSTTKRNTRIKRLYY